MAASRCAGLICLRLIPPRGTNPVGKFDHRARCFASSKAYWTFCRWSGLSVARNLLAALTISAIFVCAGAGLEKMATSAKAQRRAANWRKVFICSVSEVTMLLHSLDGEISFRTQQQANTNASVLSNTDYASLRINALRHAASSFCRDHSAPGRAGLIESLPPQKGRARRSRHEAVWPRKVSPIWCPSPTSTGRLAARDRSR